MKITLLTASLFSFMTVSIMAQTNLVANAPTNAPADFNKIDITLSSAGTSYGNQNESGFDFSVSIDPIEQLPSLWFGVSQSLYWAPQMAASTDVDVAWNFAITDKIYILPGWSVGDVYGGNIDNLIRTGPEVYIQYYINDTVYLYGGVNYDLVTKQANQGWSSSGSNNGWRWSIGIGIEL